MKHTTGEWTQGNLCIRDVEGRIIAKCDYPHILFLEAEANAKLIAAAPELLENLVRLLDRINENDLWNMFPSACERAEVAIKKATE